jgi:hypothetical protein
VKIAVAKSKEVKNGRNLADYSKDGYGSKRAVLSMMMMMMMNRTPPSAKAKNEEAIPPVPR